MGGDTASNATCPRCGGGFHCGVHDTTPCPCTTLELEPALIKSLEARYLGCLCLACLAELQAQPSADPQKEKPARS